MEFLMFLCVSCNIQLQAELTLKPDLKFNQIVITFNLNIRIINCGRFFEC